MADLIELRAARDAARERLDTLLVKDLTSEEGDELVRLEGELRELARNVEIEETKESVRKQLAEPSFSIRRSSTIETKRAAQTIEEGAVEWRENMQAAMQGRAAIGTATIASGAGQAAIEGNPGIIPEVMQNEMIRRLADLSAIRQVCQVRNYGTNVSIPIVTSRGQGAWVGEGGTAPEFNTTFDSISAKAFKTFYKSMITWEMLQDNIGGALPEILLEHAEEHAVLQDEKFITSPTVASADSPDGLGASFSSVTKYGTGNKPADVLTAGDEAVADDLLAAMLALPGKYRVGSKSWIMSPATHGAVMTSLDDTGRALAFSQSMGTIQQNPLAVGTLYGYPIFLSDHMGGDTAGDLAAALVDQRSCAVIDRLGVTSQVDPFSNADSGIQTYRSWARSDFRWLLPESCARVFVKS